MYIFVAQSRSQKIFLKCKRLVAKIFNSQLRLKVNALFLIFLNTILSLILIFADLIFVC